MRRYFHNYLGLAVMGAMSRFCPSGDPQTCQQTRMAAVLLPQSPVLNQATLETITFSSSIPAPLGARCVFSVEPTISSVLLRNQGVLSIGFQDFLFADNVQEVRSKTTREGKETWKFGTIVEDQKVKRHLDQSKHPVMAPPTNRSRNYLVLAPSTAARDTHIHTWANLST